MGASRFPAISYRALGLVANPATEVEHRWNQACAQGESYWERLALRDGEIHLRMEPGQELRLASLAPEALPPLAPGMSRVGGWIARHSLFARILSTRTGREEVPSYALWNQASGAGLDAAIDRALLNVGHAPICFRRLKVVEHIRRALLAGLRRQDARIAFLDIGSGGGFDGLDVLRICAAVGATCNVINVDIDADWLDRNERIATAEGVTGITRRPNSIFDYLSARTYAVDLQGTSELIVSCNGFADFLDDEAVYALLGGIRDVMASVPGDASLVFAAALAKNRLQTFLGRLVGFNYIGRESNAVRQMVTTAFDGCECLFEEGHSQLICTVRKKRRLGGAA